VSDGPPVTNPGAGRTAGPPADCQHIAAEFVSCLNQRFVRRAFAAVALTTDSSFLTANANDFGFEHVFARQVEALGRAGDVVLGITTSGNSSNVVAALTRGRQLVFAPWR
jgi:D-sedoheptulose 7-phosphate isomerase